MKKIIFFTITVFLLTSCIPVQAPYLKKDIPFLTVYIGEELNINLYEYFGSRQGQNLAFVITEGEGEILGDRYYYFKPTVEFLENQPSKSFILTITCYDQNGRSVSATTKVIVKLSPDFERIYRFQDQYILSGKALEIEFQKYFPSLSNVEITSGKGKVQGTKYTYTPSHSGETFDVSLKLTEVDGSFSWVNFKVYVVSYNFRLELSEYTSGPAVDNATVTFRSQGNIISHQTNEEGILEAVIPEGTYDIEITKEGYAKAIISNVVIKNSVNLKLNLRKPLLGNQKPEFSLSANLYKDSALTQKLDSSNVSSNFYVKVSAKESVYEIAHLYAKLGSLPSASFFTNRLYSEEEELVGTIDISGYVGEVPMFITAYNRNDDSYTKIEYLTILRFSTDVNHYKVESKNPAVRAVTRRDGVRYYSLNSMKEDINIYIEVSWKKWENSSQKSTSDKPVGYKIYRSFDGERFEPIGIVDSNTDILRDSSVLLREHNRVWYGVSSLYNSSEGPMEVMGSVVPLPMFKVEYIYPSDGSTNVLTDPVFQFRFVGLEKYNVTYFYDIWLYDEIVNDKSGYSPYNDQYIIFESTNTQVSHRFSDNRWKNYFTGMFYESNRLQKNKPYCWGNEYLVAVLKEPENNSEAIVVHTDIVKVYGIEPEIYNTFTTGSD